MLNEISLSWKDKYGVIPLAGSTRGRAFRETGSRWHTLNAASVPPASCPRAAGVERVLRRGLCPTAQPTLGARLRVTPPQTRPRTLVHSRGLLTFLVSRPVLGLEESPGTGSETVSSFRATGKPPDPRRLRGGLSAEPAVATALTGTQVFESQGQAPNCPKNHFRATL